MAIHPDQLATIVECFTPSASQVAEALELLTAVDQTGGVVVLPDGRMADPAMIGRAREVTALAREIELRS
jgi:citrate lyase subunit beta/citryl-CoA lyase